MHLGEAQRILDKYDRTIGSQLETAAMQGDEAFQAFLGTLPSADAKLIGDACRAFAKAARDGSLKLAMEKAVEIASVNRGNPEGWSLSELFETACVEVVPGSEQIGKKGNQ